MNNTYVLPEGIELSASTDPSRYITNGVYWNNEKHEWAATDGKQLAVIGEPDRDSPSVIIPLATIKRHRKTGCPVVLEADKRHVTCAGETVLIIEGMFPNYRGILSERFFKDYEGGPTISIDFELLSHLVASIATEGKGRSKTRAVTFTLASKSAETSPLLVRETEAPKDEKSKRGAVKSGGFVGALMPLRVS